MKKSKPKPVCGICGKEIKTTDNAVIYFGKDGKPIAVFHDTFACHGVASLNDAVPIPVAGTREAKAAAESAAAYLEAVKASKE